MVKGLFKTVIVIWSEFDPEDYDIEDLSREALKGDAHCSAVEKEFVDDPSSDPDWEEKSK